MKLIDRIIVSFGILDILLVFWVLLRLLADGTFQTIAETLSSGPGILIAIYLSLLAAASCLFICILSSGVLLVQRRSEAAWLNYLLTPLRIIFLLPTLFPLFALLRFAGAEYDFIAGLIAIASSELIRAAVIYRWHRSQPKSEPANNSFKPNSSVANQMEASGG